MSCTKAQRPHLFANCVLPGVCCGLEACRHGILGACGVGPGVRMTAAGAANRRLLIVVEGGSGEAVVTCGAEWTREGGRWTKKT